MKYVCTAFTRLSVSSQGWCLVSEEGRFVLRISLSERGDKHLDKLKPYVLENIVVLLVLPPPEDAAGLSLSTFMHTLK